VIQDVDETLKELLVRKVPLDTALVDVKFDMPTREWSTGISRPTVNVYLYDVRENHELRSSQRSLARNGNIGTQQRAPVRIDLCYLISVWTTDISDEHQLLGQILTTLLRFPILPDDVLRGSMPGQPFPVRGWIAQPERSPNVWDVWGHLDHRMKACLSYAVTTSFEPFAPEQVQLVTRTVMNIRSQPEPQSIEE
jgi:hypothetical protein